ncbi:hypothetical protein H7J84_14210 [Mycobacterium goodii]|uniref:hypothetical protein n=1 Tax=Mycolicibacterium goodii TaxID=134601 RepID=UPI001054A4AB|nr:hypothetical protein [Mycolicibacterium goodii]MCV7293685.1 hypothetical protein [Mycolicibacterium goodii]
MQATLTSARPKTGRATTQTGRQTAWRTAIGRAATVFGIAAAVTTLTPLAGAMADDEPASPGTPIIRSGERGEVMSGVGEERIAEQQAVLGGDSSSGAPIFVKDGNPAELPVIDGEAGVICSKGQAGKAGVITCS